VPAALVLAKNSTTDITTIGVLEDVTLLCRRCHEQITSGIRDERRAYGDKTLDFEPVRQSAPEPYRPARVRYSHGEINGRLSTVSDHDFRPVVNHAQRANGLEYEAGLYLDSQKRVILPSKLLEAAIVEGAKCDKEGQLALAGLYVDTDAVLEYEGGPLAVADLIESDAHRLVAGVTVGQGTVMRTRPIFKNWRATFLVSLNPESANERQLQQWVQKCGSVKGLCDWRPRHGRFVVEQFQAVTWTKAAA
jgi:hypothetical protein